MVGDGVLGDRNQPGGLIVAGEASGGGGGGGGGGRGFVLAVRTLLRSLRGAPRGLRCGSGGRRLLVELTQVQGRGIAVTPGAKVAVHLVLEVRLGEGRVQVAVGGLGRGVQVLGVGVHAHGEAGGRLETVGAAVLVSSLHGVLHGVHAAHDLPTGENVSITL